jgi:uncharacterized membrane protein
MRSARQNLAVLNDSEPASRPAPRPRPSSASVADENIRAVARLQAKALRQRTFAQRVGDTITVHASRESSVVVHIVWFGVWIAINTGHGLIRPFDPFPFTLLTTLVSLEAIFLTLFVLASENRLTQDANRRGQLDLQVNLLAEQEMTLVLRMLKEICEHLDLRDTITSQKFRELAKRTDVSELAEQLEHCEVDEITDGSGGAEPGVHSVAATPKTSTVD